MSGSHLSGKPTVFISTTSSTAFLRAVRFYRYYDMKHDTANVLLHHALHDHDNYTQKHLIDKCSQRLKFSLFFILCPFLLKRSDSLTCCRRRKEEYNTMETCPGRLTFQMK